MNESPIRIGVSSCLLGAEVRFDGGHKRDRFMTDQLGAFVEWVPFCPEVEAGLGIPRPAMRLVEEEGRERLVEIRSRVEHTPKLEHGAGHLNAEWFHNRCEARTVIGDFRDEYNHDRPHSSLDYRTPTEVRSEWVAKQSKQQEISATLSL